MITAGTVMRPDVECINVRDTMDFAAQRMRQLDVGALPVCDGEGHPVGIVTDRDIVVKVVGVGLNPRATTAGNSPRARRSCTPSTSARISVTFWHG